MCHCNCHCICTGQFFWFSDDSCGKCHAGYLTERGTDFCQSLCLYGTRAKAGDVVVFLPNGNEKSHYYVRRVIACPGDTVQIKNGKVYINGELYKEDIVSASIEDPGVAADEVKLGDDEYFVLGDNRNSSEDSRMANIGNVKKDYIIGKAWFHFKGFGKMGLID